MNKRTEDSLKDNVNIFYADEKIFSFIYIDENPMEKFNYFKNDFNICNYMFIVPNEIVDVFSKNYSKILKNPLTFFPSNFQEALELLNDYEKEEGIKGNWIIISTCYEIEKNIQKFHENKNIYRFIAFCPITNHIHEFDHTNRFYKFYGIVDSPAQLITKLFTLNNIFYYRKKQNYGINVNETFEFKFETKLLVDYNNNCSKKSVLDEKYISLCNFKYIDDECYFVFIKSFNLINNWLEKKQYDFLFHIVGNIASNLMFFSVNDFEKKLSASKLLKNLHILYLYFSNYPYLFGVMTNEEINDVLSQFTIDIAQSKLQGILVNGYNLITQFAETLASQIENGMSILNDIPNLKLFHRLLIELICVNEELIEGKKIEELSQFYQIKNFLRDIDFCLHRTLVNIISICNGYPFLDEIKSLYLNRDIRASFFLVYSNQCKIQNDIEDEQAKNYNNALKYNYTLVVGDTNFHMLIKKMNLPCEKIEDLTEDEFSKFFEVPKKKNNYNICKYFLIMNEKNGFQYIETIRYISNVFGILFATIIYVENKNSKIDKKIFQNPFIHLVLTYSEEDILNYYYNNFIIREMNISNIDLNLIIGRKVLPNTYKFPKINNSQIIREYDNGWDMKKDIDTNIFSLANVDEILGLIDIAKFNLDMYNVYKENNCLDLFINYYGNYLAGDYLIEQTPPLLTIVKMFLYAYTLDENNKSFYIFMNNDLRSGNVEKIVRYLPMFKNIYNLIKKII